MGKKVGEAEGRDAEAGGEEGNKGEGGGAARMME